MGIHEKNIRSTKIKLILLSIVFICLAFTSGDNFLREKRTSIILQESKCKNKISCKYCMIQQFVCDQNIFFRKKEGEYRSIRNDADQGCFAVDLFLYKHKISLDSIYYGNIQNKELLYIGGFIEGTYLKQNDRIILNLSLLNAAINSSRPTTHFFVIQYNLKKNIVEKIKIRFE